MKKAWCALRIMLISIAFLLLTPHAATAKEISIAGYTYPMIILVPIISIIISSIIIIFILVRVTKKEGGRFLREGKKEVKRRMVPFLRKELKEEKKKENVYLKEIKRFRRDLPKISVDDGFDKLSQVTKDFFKDLLGLQYEFTYDELANEIKKRRMKEEFLDLIKRLSHLRYSGSKVTKEELEDFAGMIESIIKKETRRKEEKELGVSKALTKEKKGVISSIAKLGLEGREEARKKHILELMKEEEEALKKDMDIARDIYHRILSSYYKLPANERKEVYDKLVNFYNEVNHMLFSSFYGKRGRKELEYFSDRLAKLKKEAERVEKIMQEKPTRKVEEAIKRLKLPELKVKPTKEITRERRRVEISKERIKEKEELKKLEEVEKRAKERIKRISESVVKERMSSPLPLKIEKEKIREIKPEPVTRLIKPLETPEPIKAIRHLPEHKIHEVKREAEIKQKIREEPRKEAKEEKKIPKPIEPKPHVERIEKEAGIKRQLKEKSPGIESESREAKEKKLGTLEREEQAIMERLERLRRYVG